MATRKNARIGQRSPQLSLRSREKVAALVRQSFVHALRICVASQAEAARWMGVARTTVQRWVAGESPVDVHAVLRSRRLAYPFSERLCRLVAVRNGRAA